MQYLPDREPKPKSDPLLRAKKVAKPARCKEIKLQRNSLTGSGWLQGCTRPRSNIVYGTRNAVVPPQQMKKMKTQLPSTTLKSFILCDSPAMEAPSRPLLPGQAEETRICPNDKNHLTECFAAKSGVLYWRCTGCLATSGTFIGKPTLLGKDGEVVPDSSANKKKRQAIEPAQGGGGPSFGGKHYSLADVMKALETSERQQQEVLERLRKLETRLGTAMKIVEEPMSTINYFI